MPGFDRLPRGPVRNLVQALHGLYQEAGMPGARAISDAIRARDDLRDTVSHETISAALRGDGLPRWSKVECLVRQLAAWAVSQPDPDAVVRMFHGLWLDAAASWARAGAVSRNSGPVVVVSRRPNRTPNEQPPGTVVDRHRRASRRVITNVPPRNTDFIGRAELLGRMRQALLRPAAPPLVLHGLGGVGKTQVAIEYVHRSGAGYDVVWWVPAETPALARASLALLGEYLEVAPSLDMQQTVRVVLYTLETRGLRWLLVFDNADLPQDVNPLMPMGGGHVMVTTRNQTWAARHPAFDVAAFEVDVFERHESVELLLRRGRGISPEEAAALAEKLGDLPLAVEQVAAIQAATGMPAADYLKLFDRHVQELLSQGAPSVYPTTVAAFLQLAFDQLQVELVAAAQLLGLFGFLSPEPVSVALLRSGRDGALSRPLSHVLREPADMWKAVGALSRYGLARVDHGAHRIQVHRLFQLWLREAPGADFRDQSRANARSMLAAANPGKPDDPRTWALHAEIGPHILPADLIGAGSPEARRVVLDQVRYLFGRGDYAGSRDLAEEAVNRWSRPPAEGGLGPDHEQTLLANRHLANALRLLGHYRRARTIDEDTLHRLRRNPGFGEHHRHTIAVGLGLGVDLRLAGDLVAAEQRDRENLERSRHTYGEDDPHTLIAKNNVAASLRLLGDFQSAHSIDSEVVDHWRHTRGDTHPRTLWAVSNLARDLYGLGRYAEALDLQRQAYPAFSEQLGVEHNEVLLAARTIAIALRKTGVHGEALDLARANYDSYHRRFGPDHEHTLAAIMSYANTLRVVGRLPEAHALATEAVGRYRRIFGEQHPLTLAAEVNQAIILRALGRRREARDTDTMTLEELRQVLGDSHPYTLCAANGLACDLALDHDERAARALSSRTLALSRRVRGARHPDTLACAVNAALDLERTDDQPAADRLLSETVNGLKAVFGDDHPETVNAARRGRAECDIEPPPT
jgi:tetratricopeptide (TPR) repeat protein